MTRHTVSKKCYVTDWNNDRTKFTIVSYDGNPDFRVEFEPETEEERKLIIDSIENDIPIYVTMEEKK